MSNSKKQSERIFDQSDFPVSHVRGTIFQGTGHDMEELAQKPLVGVANSHTEMNPGHMHLAGLAARVKDGVQSAGGIPFEFNVPAPCDGIAMGHAGMRFVLAQRDLIADMVETHVRSMCLDAVVFIASCDKILPGMIMAAARLDLPCIFVTGGPNAMRIRMTPAMKGSISHKDYEDINDKFATATCATCGACEIMGTANTFQCLAEALGLCLPATANIPAYAADRLLYARKSGQRIVRMCEEELTAGKILTRESLLNALRVDLAIGGSTNATLHLPAIAHAMGEELPLSTFNEYNRSIPTIAGIAPNGPYGITDLYIAGGIPAVMSRIAGNINKDCVTVSGRTVGEIIADATVLDDKVIRPRDNPHMEEGGTVVLFGNLAPDGAVVKQSAVARDMRTFSGPAKVFESESACLAAIREQKVEDGMVLVIRNEGPRGAPGMPEMLAVTMALDLGGYERTALVTDGRFSGATSGPCVGHVSPEAHGGGPIGLVRDDDVVMIDIPNRKIELAVTDEEMGRRGEAYKPSERYAPPGYMRRYRKLVGSAAGGATLD
ncbi:MAG: dihydroxy-acid dehydratase [Desulfatibacillaceae bacterium]